MFQFARLSLSLPCSKVVNTNYGKGVSPFGNLRIIGCSAPTRSLSQPATSFIVVYYQGIHHILLTVYDTWLFHFICHSFGYALHELVIHNYYLHAWSTFILVHSTCMDCCHTWIAMEPSFFRYIKLEKSISFNRKNKSTHRQKIVRNYSLFSRMILLSRGSG